MDTPRQEPDRPHQITVSGLTSWISQHPDHGPVLYLDGHSDEYLTRPDLDAYIAHLTAMRKYVH